MNTIIRFAVDNYRFTLVVFLAVLAMGIATLLGMPRSEDPEIQSPQFAVVVVYPGTSAADMEELVVDDMESAFHALDDIKSIQTEISDGLAVVQVEYQFESNPDDKYQEIIREINALRGSLPQDIAAISVQKFTPTDVNIYQMALISETASYATLDDIAEELSDKLEQVPSLKNVVVHGLPQREVQVELDMQKLASMNLPVSAVLGAIQSENVNIPGGSITAGGRKFNVKTSGDYASVEDIASTVITGAQGSVVRLSDVATVRTTYGTDSYIVRHNGYRAVFLAASMKSGQNILDVQTKVEQVLASAKTSLPSNVALETVFDQTKSVSARLSRFGKDFLIAIGLVLLTLLPLGFRASVVVMISIPLSLAIGLILMNLLGFNLNQLSIVGMIVALGILVDDSIVVVENIERFLRNGIDRTKAAIGATSQIALAVVGCTVLLMFAFLPLVFLPEQAGAFIRSLPMAVLTTVFASMVVSLTVVPFLSSKILKNHHVGQENIFLRGLKAIISGSYSKVLDASLRHPARTLVVAGLIFLGALALIPAVGFSLFPTSEKPMFLVNVELPDGTALSTTDSVARRVERRIMAFGHPIRSVSTNVGKGNPRVYYNVIQKNESEQFAQLFVQLDEHTDVRRKRSVIDALRQQLRDVVGARVEIKDFEQGPPIDAPLAYRLYSEDLDTLRKAAAIVETVVRQTPGTIYVNNPLAVQPTDARVIIDRTKAGSLGIATADVDRMVRLGIAGLPMGTYREQDGDELPIMVTVPKQERRPSFDVFDNIQIPLRSGAMVPLRSVVDVGLETSPNRIRHYDRNRTVTISAFTQSDANVGDRNAAIVKALESTALPKGVTYTVAGEVESRQESFGGISTIILVTIFGFIAVLILEFKTFKSIAIVLSVIPLGIIGAVVALLVAGETFSFVATIGMIALVGIEVKNSLLLVDFTNQLRAQGKELVEAIREAGEVRFVPIVLTSLTAIGGLLPLVIEYNQLYSPLAIVLIGGLVSSTLLSRLVTPVMYRLLPPDVRAAA